MALNETIGTLGRRIRAAVIGGGEGALIGSVHRTALRFDDHFEIVAGVLSSDPQRSLDQGAQLGLQRPYGTLAELLTAESARVDGVDVIVIMTPNDSHFASCLSALRNGFHVICDKPIANTLVEARELLEEARRHRRHLFVTYNFTGYPMVRQARAMIEQGKIGEPHLVEVRYAQGNLGALIEKASAPLDRQLAWRLDPARGGDHHLLLDVGVHAHNLATYVTKRECTRVFCDAGAAVTGREFDDSAVILGRLDGDVRASLSMTKAATGMPMSFTLSVYGNKAGLSWEQSSPNELRFMRQGRAAEIYGRSVSDLAPLAKRSIRSANAHPEGLREAFANIYGDFAEILGATLAGRAPDPLALTCPTILEGARSLAFVDACALSKLTDSWVSVQGIDRAIGGG